jgi:hypothetical protein
MDELDLNLQGVVIRLGDDVIGRDNRTEMGRGRMDIQKHECCRNNGYSNYFCTHGMHLLIESKIVIAGTSLLPRTRAVFASLQTKKAMKAGSSFQKKRPSWPVYFELCPCRHRAAYFFNNAAASTTIIGHAFYQAFQ